ncbi:hypothetical protein CcCBS67573_g09509 [Chytriomyces confervae]|uniref:Uncharacterized protein n=1 Tax=Chytriomyces confervae TaxID=246404 RepID=A0A507DUI3_9FUNG|nr:hypothetical protein CcCBS67573_g09509 [Chytriomyces confervae]
MDSKKWCELHQGQQAARSAKDNVKSGAKSAAFIKSLAYRGYSRDLEKKENGARGRWKRVIAFLSNDPWFCEAIQNSVYSGIPLVSLQRAGRNQFSIQNPDDNETYYKAWLHGILVWCSFLEQLMLNIPHLKTPDSKKEFLLLLVDLWNEGCEYREGISTVPPATLSEEDKKAVAAKHWKQASTTPQHAEFWESSGLHCSVFGSKGNLTQNSSRHLSIDSLINGSMYTLTYDHNRIVYNFVNKAKEGWQKDIINEVVKSRPELNSLHVGILGIEGKLKDLVETRQIAVGDRVYDSIAEYFGMLIVAALMR